MVRVVCKFWRMNQRLKTLDTIIERREQKWGVIDPMEDLLLIYRKSLELEIPKIGNRAFGVLAMY